MIRRGALLLGALVAAALVAGLAAADPAVADMSYVPSENSGATVTHLNIVGRHGTIGATVTVGLGDKIVGLVVDIPAAGGTWKPAAKVTLRAGITCTGGSGTDSLTDPLYTCLTPIDPQVEELHKSLPRGRFSITLPIDRPTGPTRGMTGTVGLVRTNPYGSPDLGYALTDTFPVISPTLDTQSSAELKNLPLGMTNVGGNLYEGDLDLHVIVKPGEDVTGVYVTLPTSPTGIVLYTMRDTPSAYGISCGEQDLAHPAPNTFVVRCQYPHGTAWPAGAYSLSALIAAICPGGGGTAVVDVALGNGERHTVDTGDVFPDSYYRAPRH